MTSSRIAALTGRPGIGKTTAFVKIVELLRKDGVNVAGFYSREVRERGLRVGFEMVDLVSGNVSTLAWVGEGRGPRVGKYVVNVFNVGNMSKHMREQLETDVEVIAVDEIGPMELTAPQFVETVFEILNADKLSLFTVHYAAKHAVVEAVKRHAGSHLYELTLENRAIIPEKVYTVMKDWLKS
ncbi:MAG: NTPase [Candidatus Caldarchaeum sp.]